MIDGENGKKFVAAIFYGAIAVAIAALVALAFLIYWLVK